jgi:hypothetical protein
MDMVDMVDGLAEAIRLRRGFQGTLKGRKGRKGQKGRKAQAVFSIILGVPWHHAPHIVVGVSGGQGDGKAGG